jgi:glycosyltransferase involved in cell wall biosynthesis
MAVQKVLVLAPCLKAVGGVQNYSKTLVAALEEILGRDNVRMVAVPEDPELRKDGSLALSSAVKARFFLKALAVALIWRPDLVICAHVGVAPVAWTIQKYRRIHYWLVLHGIEVWAKLPPAKEQALRGAQRYMALTRFTLDATIAQHALGKPAAVILPPPFAGARNSSVPPDSASSSSSFSSSSPPSAPMVLTVGRLAAAERYKGHDVMLEAWPAILRSVPDAEYWIVGDGDDRSELESLAKDLGIADSVHFTGTLSGDELHAAYDRCRVFAMPARTKLNGDGPQGEGFGIVFLEAMSHAKPIVAPRTGAPAEFIRTGEHGWLVDPSDRQEIAAALIDLLTNPDRARQMGKSAQDWVAREFTHDNFLGRLRAALQQERANT